MLVTAASCCTQVDAGLVGSCEAQADRLTMEFVYHNHSRLGLQSAVSISNVDKPTLQALLRYIAQRSALAFKFHSRTIR